MTNTPLRPRWLGLLLLGVLSLSAAAQTSADNLLRDPRWLPLTPVEQAALADDSGKLHDLPLRFTPYNTARPKLPRRVQIVIDRDAYFRNDPFGQAVIYLIGEPWRQRGAELVVQLRRAEQVVTEQRFASPQSPKLALLLALGTLDAGNYTLTARLEGVTMVQPAPSCSLVVRADARPVEPFPAEGVPLLVHEQDALPDAVWPIRTGVPLPRGTLTDPAQLQLLEDGQPIPAQFTPRAHWDPARQQLKWVGLDFLARYQQGKPREYRVMLRSAPVQANPAGVSVTPEGERLIVRNGVMQFAVNTHRFTGLEEARWLDADGNPGAALLDGGNASGGKSGGASEGGAFLMDERLFAYAGALDDGVKVWVEEQGPVQATIAAEGWHVNDKGERVCRFQTRLRFYAGLPQVQAEHVVVLTYDTDRKRLRQLGLAFVPAGATSYRFGGDTIHAGELTPVDKGAHPSVSLHQDRHDHYRLTRWSNATGINMLHPSQEDEAAELAQGKHGEGWVSVTTPGGTITLAARNFWQLFPKELEVSPNQLLLHLWPAHGHEAYSLDEALSARHLHQIRYAHQGAYLDLALPTSYYERFSSVGKELAGPLGNMRFLEQQDINALGGNGQGLAASVQFELSFAPAAPAPDAAAQEQARARLFQHDPHALTDPVYNGLTGVEGRFAGKKAGRFADVERLFSLGFRGFTMSVDVLENYGMWIWPDTHNNWSLGDMAPDTHRWWLNSHYQGVWEGTFLYFRSGDYPHHVWSRDNNEHFANVGTVNYADPHEPLQGKLPGANYHTKGFLPWGSARFGERTSDDYVEVGAHFINPDAHLLRYLLFGDHRKLQLAQAWFDSVNRVALPPERSREACTTLGELLSYYETTFDPQAIVLYRDLLDDLCSRPWPEVPAFPGHPLFHDRWYQRAWELTGDPRLPEQLLSWLKPENTSAYRNAHYLYPQIRAIAYRMTGDADYLRNILTFVAQPGLDIYDNPADPRLTGFGGRSYFFPTHSWGQMVPYYLQALLDAHVDWPAQVDRSVPISKTMEPKRDDKPGDWFPTTQRYANWLVGYVTLAGAQPRAELTFTGFTHRAYGANDPVAGRLRITDADGHVLLDDTVLPLSQREQLRVTLDAQQHRQPFRLDRIGQGLLQWTGPAEKLTVNPDPPADGK